MMKRFLWMVIWGVPCSGCTVMPDSTQPLIVESLYRWVSHCQHQQEATIALAAVRTRDPSCSIGPHYVDGFLDGFVSCQDAGGRCEAPVVPPPRYWKERYQSPAGQQAIGDWYAGFCHGASAAGRQILGGSVVEPTAMPGQAGNQLLPVPDGELTRPGGEFESLPPLETLPPPTGPQQTEPLPPPLELESVQASPWIAPDRKVLRLPPLEAPATGQQSSSTSTNHELRLQNPLP